MNAPANSPLALLLASAARTDAQKAADARRLARETARDLAAAKARRAAEREYADTWFGKVAPLYCHNITG